MTSTFQQASVAKFNSKEVLIGIVGLGYLGLPLMLRYNAIDFRVLGIDIDVSKVDMLSAGGGYIEALLPKKVAAARSKSSWCTLFRKLVLEC